MRLHREIGRKVAAAAEELGVEFLLVSRGDSTLRGHYPAETESLRAVSYTHLDVYKRQVE